MKKCSSCGAIKPLDNFYKQSKSRDGYNCICKLCSREYGREYKKKNRKKIAAQQRGYTKRHPNYQREYRSKNSGYWIIWENNNKDRRREYDLLDKERYPEHHLARMAVKNAKAKGLLAPQPCEVCGSIYSEAHHHKGYAEENWLEIVWLCKQHHT